MVCCIMKDCTGVSKTVTDKVILEYLKDVNKLIGRDAYEVEQYTLYKHRMFRKPEPVIRYQVYYGCTNGEWQVMMCAGHEYSTVNAYLLGLINGLEHFINKTPNKVVPLKTVN